MNKPTILITRPEPLATKTAQKLQQMGYTTIISPVISQQLVIDAEILLQHALPQYDAVILTSGYGLQILAKSPQALSKKLYLTGQILAAQAAQLGFTQIEYGDGNARSLLRHMQHKANKDLRYLCLHSNHQAVNMAESLQGLGFDAEGLEIYHSKAVEALSNEAIEALGGQKIKAVMLYSAMSAHSFVQLVNQAGVTEQLQFVEAWCISENIADSIPAGLFKCFKVKILDVN